jgi:hypothetical protein
MNLHLVQLAKNKIPDFSKSTPSKKMPNCHCEWSVRGASRREAK